MHKQDPFVGSTFTTPSGSTITITGYFSHRRDRRYTCVCSICSLDTELWPDGFMTCIRSQVRDRGVIPCGCSSHPMWKVWQWEILVSRQAAKLGHEFIGFPRGFNGCHSHLSLKCREHGEWHTSRMSNFLLGHACPKCGIAQSSDSLSIPDQQFIERAMSGETYPAGTVLIPGKSRHSPWTLICPICKDDEISKLGVGPSSFSLSRRNMKRGLTPCRCAHNYKMTIGELEYKASASAKKNGYEFSRWYSEDSKKSVKSMAYAKCKEHGEFRISFSNLVYHERGCPSCSVTGFKNDLDGFVYALRSDCGAYIKVGISNKPEIRIPQLSKATPFQFSVDGIFKTTGTNAKDTERATHIEFMSAGLSGFDGCTEWLRYDPEIVRYVEERAI